MDLTILTYLNTLVIIVALVIMSGILYTIRKDQIRLDEQNNTITLQTAATLEVAREILRQVKK